MKIGVFCSANSNIDKDFFTMTAELGRWIGENGKLLKPQMTQIYVDIINDP